MLRLVSCIAEQHDASLTAVAVLVCALASMAAVHLAGRSMVAPLRERAAWVVGVAVAFGGGVWATHFVAMLAFQPGLPVSFGMTLTLVSLVLPMVGSAVGFGLFAWNADMPAARLAAGAVVGASISAMHFVGMAALRVAAVVEYDGAAVVAAIVFGVLCAALALLVLGYGRQKLAAALLVAATCGVHFIAMGGLRLTPSAAFPPGMAAGSSQALGITIAVVAIMVLAVSLTAAALDRRRVAQVEAEARRLRRLLDSTFEGILFHRGGVVTEVNARLCALLGREREALLGARVGDLLGDAVGPGAAMDGEAASVEVSLRGADGLPLAVEVLARPLVDAGQGEFVVAVRDISDRKQAEQRIAHLANHDPLTGLANRTLFVDIATRALALASRSRHRVALLCVDIEGLGDVNDVFGMRVGDALLVEAAARLAGATRQMDTPARLGGDEFAILQQLADQPQAAATLAERLVRLFAHPFEIDGHSIMVGASVGIALCPADAASIEGLLRNAMLALDRAKQDGKDTFRFFEPGMDARMRERRQLEADLREALANNELEVHYQGQFDTARLELTGYEALVRWTHKRRGRVSPAEFVPVAESSGLIRQLGDWVLETACREAADWPNPLRVSVNLSPAQFRWGDLPHRILDTLDRAGLAPERLELEITEGVLIDDTERALTMLREVKSHGVRIALDDFGTGYSSLGYLRRFPFDTLKIDKSFVQEIGENAEADAIIRAVIGLGHSLNLDVTAEGVETATQLAHLQAQNCHLVQGFLLARPMPATELPHLTAMVEPARA